MSFVKDMADVFPAYDNEEARKCLEGDFRELGAVDAVRYFDRAEAILEAYMGAAEHLDVCLYVALGEAKERAKEARAVAERYAGAAALR